MSYSRSRCNSERFDDPEVLAEIQFAKENNLDYTFDIEQTNGSGKRSRNNSIRSVEKITNAKSPAKPKLSKSSSKSSSKAEKKARARGISGCSIKKSKSFSDEYDSYCSDDFDNDSSEEDISDGNEDYESYRKDSQNHCITTAIVDYFTSLEMEQTVSELAPFLINDQDIFFVFNKIITYPLETGDHGLYNAVSSLLIALTESDQSQYNNRVGILTRVIEDVLLNIKEWMLDCPKTINVFAALLARFVLDGIFDKGFITSIRAKVCIIDDAEVCTTKAMEIIEQPEMIYQVLPSDGGFRPIDSLTNDICKILKNLLHGDTIDECRKKLNALNAPMYKHEIVYQAALLSANENDKTTTCLLGDLITSMFDSKEITQYNIASGIKRFFNDIDNKLIKVCKNEIDGFVDILRRNTDIGCDGVISCN
uniref:Programmed cell death protein 4 n=1 Tax=Parastrongyloides trichosuri TaxID=131310 RepID=A0A0N4ZCE1_PARTI